MKRRALLLASAAFAVAAGCVNFDADLSSFCTMKPELCSDGGTGGTGGGTTGTGGGTANTGGGTGGCGPFGATCTKEGDCCTTTSISGTDYPMACSRIGFCQLTEADCRGESSTCATADQCCSGNCDATGRCSACSVTEGSPCTDARNCCGGYVCGTDSQCHASSVGDTGPSPGAACKVSGECVSGYCAMDGGLVGVCESAAMGMCTPLGMPGANPCPGLEAGTTVCVPNGGLCVSQDDCCATQAQSGNGGCWGFSVNEQVGHCYADQPTLGQTCDDTANCKIANNFCDPVAGICVDRWCFNSLATPPAFKGCCIISSGASTCTFVDNDAGACLMPGATASDPLRCCGGTIDPQNPGTCGSVQVYDP
jgi:hypothetical protein